MNENYNQYATCVGIRCARIRKFMYRDSRRARGINYYNGYKESLVNLAKGYNRQNITFIKIGIRYVNNKSDAYSCPL